MPFTLFSASYPFIINTLKKKKKKVKSSQTGKGYVERNNGSIRALTWHLPFGEEVSSSPTGTGKIHFTFPLSWEALHT